MSKADDDVNSVELDIIRHVEHEAKEILYRKSGRVLMVHAPANNKFKVRLLSEHLAEFKTIWWERNDGTLSQDKVAERMFDILGPAPYFEG